MANPGISPGLSNAIDNVLTQTSITEFTLDVQITNTDDASYTYVPDWIDALYIAQSFGEKIADDLHIQLSLSPPDYMKLFNNSKSLQCAIRLVYYDSQRSQRIFSTPPIARIYKAFLQDPQDLSKKYTTGALMPTQSMPLTEQHVGARIHATLHLIESSVYTLRQQKFHGIYSKVKIGDVIAHILQSFSITQFYMVPPDNIMVYDHIVIPPAEGFDTIFDLLQYQYGVYMKGIDWYYTGGILYIYPAYENTPAISYTANIYNAPSGNYAGMHSYHYNNPLGNTLSIVSTTKVETQDISRPAAENSGNAFSFLRASSIIDNYVTTNANGTFINNNNALTVSTVTDRTMSKNANNPKHTKTTDNIFEQSSRLAKMDAVLIGCGWKNAVPYLLYPGHSLKYQFDRNSVFTTQQGCLERVIYSFTRQRQLSHGFVFGGDATLRFRAISDVTNTPQSTGLSSS